MDTDNKENYKKELSFMDIVLTTIGYVIGAGIFVVISIASKYGKQFTWISVLICAVLAICTGLSFAELSSIFNKNGGEYYYVKEAFNKKFATIVAYFIIAIEIIILNVVAFGLGNYINSIVNIPIILIAAAFLIGFGYLNYLGIRKSINYNNFTTIIEVFGLLLIILFSLTKFNTDIFDISKFKLENIGPILIGAGYIYFAFFGYDMVIDLSEETKDSKTTIPNAMITGIVVSTIIYILIIISAISTVGWKAISKSKSPMVDIAKAILGNKGGIIMFIIAIISMSNTLLMSHVGASRFIQSVAEEIKLPFNINKIDKKTKTPKNAIIVITLISLLCLIFGNLENVLSIGNIGMIILFLIINICVISLRLKKPHINRPFKIKGSLYNIPISSIIGVLGSVLLIIYLIKSKIF